jgi:hypothetical protein
MNEDTAPPFSETAVSMGEKIRAQTVRIDAVFERLTPADRNRHLKQLRKLATMVNQVEDQLVRNRAKGVPFASPETLALYNTVERCIDQVEAMIQSRP